MGSTSLLIAWRYLFAKKSRSAVTAISAVSVCGVALATAAIVCVLSVFNGFREVLSGNLSKLQADVVVLPAEGKVFASADSLAEALMRTEGVESAMPAITDKALAIYAGREMPVTLHGVDLDRFRHITRLDSTLLTQEKPVLVTETTAADPDDPFADTRAYGGILSVGVAGRLGVDPASSEKLIVFAPRREGSVNIHNPINSFLRDSVSAEGVFRTQQSDFDGDMIIVDTELARAMFEYDTEATSIEIRAKAGTDPAELAERIGTQLGPRFEVKDRFRRQATNFRMIEIEKWITFLLLTFILIIASFNVLGSLSIVVLDKRDNLHTLSVMGAPRRLIGNIFYWESFLVTALGALAGIALGAALCLLQEHYGLIRLNGDAEALVVSAYPVKLNPLDLPAVIAPVIVIGLITGWITSAFAKSRLRDR